MYVALDSILVPDPGGAGFSRDLFNLPRQHAHPEQPAVSPFLFFILTAQNNGFYYDIFVCLCVYHIHPILSSLVLPPATSPVLTFEKVYNASSQLHSLKQRARMRTLGEHTQPISKPQQWHWIEWSSPQILGFYPACFSLPGESLAELA